MRTIVCVLLIALVSFPARGQEKTAVLLRQYNAAMALQNQGQYDEAVEQWAKFIREFPKSVFLPQALFNRGECLFYGVKKKEAAKQYAELLSRFPENDLADEALYALGLCHAELGQSDQSGKVFDQFLEQHPKSPHAAEVAVRRATILSQEKKYVEAAALYARISTHWPKSDLLGPATLAGGKCCYLAGNFAEAQKLLQQATAIDGQSLGEAAHWLVRSMIEQDQPDEAAAVAEKILAKLGDTPQTPQLEMDRAEAISKIPPRRGESTAHYAAIARKYPQSPLAPKALYMAARTALDSGDYSAAIQHATTFLKTYPNHELVADAMYIAAESRLQAGQLDEADKLFGKLLEKYPGHADPETWQRHLNEALYHAGEKAFTDGNFDTAAARYQQAIDQYPQSPPTANTFFRLAWALMQQGNQQQAAEVFTRLTAEHPQSPLAAEALYHMGEAAYKSGDFKKAASAFHQSWQKAGKTTLGEKATHKLGWSYFRLAKYHKAQQTFLFQRITWPDGPLAGDAAFMEGDSLLKQQNHTEARTAYQRVITQYPQSNRAPLAKQRIKPLQQ